MPTAVSAIKVDGKRAYQRVRDGEDVELAARPVTVHELDGARRAARRARSLDVDVSVRCSSGTYIRAIARDLGAALGVGGHLTALRRTAVGRVRPRPTPAPSSSSARSSRCCRSRRPRAQRFPARDLDEAQARDVRFGRALDVELDGLTAVFAPDGEFLALYEPRDGRARAVAVFA